MMTLMMRRKTTMSLPSMAARSPSGGTHALSRTTVADSTTPPATTTTGRSRTPGEPGGETRDSSASRSRKATVSAVSTLSSSGSISRPTEPENSLTSYLAHNKIYYFYKQKNSK